MIIYNVTVNIDDSVHDEWLVWIKEHIPQVLATGKFTEAKMCQVMVKEDLGGITYSIQYTTDSKETLERYFKEDANRLRQDGLQRFANKFVAFRTELNVVHHTKNFIPS